MIFLYLIFVKFNGGKNWKSIEIGPNVTVADLGRGEGVRGVETPLSKLHKLNVSQTKIIKTA